MAKFELGEIVFYPKAQELFYKGAYASLYRHGEGDWGVATPEDKAKNDYALRVGTGVIHSVYEIEGVKIWIITEWDRSKTTILLPEEF